MCSTWDTDKPILLADLFPYCSFNTPIVGHDCIHLDTRSNQLIHQWCYVSSQPLGCAAFSRIWNRFDEIGDALTNSHDVSDFGTNTTGPSKAMVVYVPGRLSLGPRSFLSSGSVFIVSLRIIGLDITYCDLSALIAFTSSRKTSLVTIRMDRLFIAMKSAIARMTLSSSSVSDTGVLSLI